MIGRTFGRMLLSSSNIICRPFLVLSILFFCHAQDLSAQGSWEKKQTPTELFLRTVFFVDSLTGWVAGDSGLILHTQNGGLDWSVQQSNTTDRIVDIYFMNETVGWASSLNYTTIPYGTILLKTTDGGESWIQHPYPEENVFINSIFFFDTLNGWMGGSPHALVHTADGGNTWTQATIDTSNLAFFPVLQVTFFNENYGYASGGLFDIAGVTWQTSDGGQMWYPINSSEAPADEVHGLYMFDSLNVIGAGGDPDFAFGAAVIRTSNGGVNWDYEELGIQGNGFDIDFVNDLEGWMPLGLQRKFAFTTDGGNTWQTTPTPSETEIYRLTFPDPFHGYAVGRDGAFLVYEPPTGVGVGENVFPGSPVTLLNNYPNPVDGLSVIIYQLSVEGDIELRMWNGNGQIIKMAEIGKRLPGRNRFEVETGHLPAGIYYYQLTVLSQGRKYYTSVRKIIRK